MNNLCVVPNCLIPRRHLQTCETEDCNGCLPGLAADGLLICNHHHDRAIRDLRTLPQLDRDLSRAVAAKGGPSGVGRVKGNPGHPGISLDQNVLDAADYLRGRLTELCAFVSIERGHTAPKWNVPAMVGWLNKHVEWMSANTELAPIWGRQVANVTVEAKRRAYRTRPDGVLIGHCTQTTDDGAVCAQPLRYKPSDYAGDRTVTCRGCGHAYTVNSLAEVADPAAAAPALDLVALLGHRFNRVIDSSTIRQWVHRYPDVPFKAGKDSKGRTLYDTAVVLTFVADTLGWHETAKLSA